MSEVNQDNKESSIVLPLNAGVKDAYIAILKTAYIEEKDIYFFHEFVQMVQAECGVSQDTAESRCKQLRLLGLLVYLNSGLGGHNYCFCMYRKDTAGKVTYIDNWQEAKPLIEAQFKNIVETEFVKIRNIMTIQGKPSGMRIEDQVKVESKTLEQAKPIHPGEDSIKSEFKTTQKMTKSEAAEIFETSLRVSSGNEATSEKQVFEGNLG